MSLTGSIRDHVESTHFIDTHEHLPDETTRLSFKPIDGRRDWDRVILDKVDDWSFLLSHYVCDDLCSAGMPPGEMIRFWKTEAPAQVKFRWIEPHWRAVRNTGFGQALRHTLRLLYGETDLTRDSVPKIAEQYAEGRRPGLYDRVLRKVARIDHCHVNSFTDSVFHVSDSPDLLRQDINMSGLTDPGEFARLSMELGADLCSLDAVLLAIDDTFQRYGKQAAAVKLWTGYTRSLHFPGSDRRRAEYAFQRYRANYEFGPDERTDLQNFLVRYAIERASAVGLPIKFHTGTYSLNIFDPGTMPLHRVRNNQGDLVRLYQDFPDARFVIFHIGYPYHNEVVTMAKQYHNVFVDMCWAWILDPAESIQFLRSFLVSAPHNKLFAFGGDYFVVEPVAGHAHLARVGITRAIASLIEDGLLTVEEAPALIESIMRGNALAIFGDADRQ
jgi:hypothetical protein